MHIDILAVGRMKSGPEQELYDRYAERIGKVGKPLHFFGPRLIEIAEARSSNAEIRKEVEASELIEKSDQGSRIFLLDETGKDCSSSEFSQMFVSAQEEGIKSIGFAIGGPDGHGKALRSRAYRSIRLGSQTWPHQLVRVMLAEQIYRALTIIAGHPYHRS